MKRILVSTCLLGEAVRYDGKALPILDPRLTRWKEEGRIIACCPECAAGLPVPRPTAECVATPGGIRVLTEAGDDLTAFFSAGAGLALDLARTHDVALAILKENSPSCGVNYRYDGRFRGLRIPGSGMTAQALRAAGIAVFSELELDRAEAFLAGQESLSG